MVLDATTEKEDAQTTDKTNSYSSQKEPQKTMNQQTSNTSTVVSTNAGNIRENERDIVLTNINKLRDPFVLRTQNRYYVFGTGWRCFFSLSKDLDGIWHESANPVQIPNDAADNYWAPEVYAYNGAYYMFTTYLSKTTGRRGCAVFRSELPEGSYILHSNGHVTPSDWDAIDGSLYVDKDGQPWMVFVHEWVSTEDNVGRMACAKLSKDLTSFISEPVELFRADDAPWATQGITDGCWVYRCKDDSLIMLWSNLDKNGYCIGMAKSASGSVTGPWQQQEELLYSKESLGDYDGGHGMIFEDYDGKLWLSLHSPNAGSAARQETPLFIPIKEENGTLVWDCK